MEEAIIANLTERSEMMAMNLKTCCVALHGESARLISEARVAQVATCACTEHEHNGIGDHDLIVCPKAVIEAECQSS